MNRLWVRLSLMISGVLFFMFFVQFLAITLERRTPNPHEDGPMDAPPAEIQMRLLEFMGLSILIGTGGGVLIASVVSRPITSIARAARRIGKGELDVQVPVRGSQEMKELADTFNRMAADLRQAEVQRNNLMNDVSHELRTPLTVLEGNLRAALDKVVPLDEAGVASLYEQTRHLIRLVNDLRELSLAEAGHLQLEKLPCDLYGLANEIIQALEPLAAEKNVVIDNEVAPRLEVSVDKFRMRQVLFNLLMNALRHTPPGGRIGVKSERRAGAVVLMVQDSGDGIEPEQLPAVFDRFYRADKSRSRETGGTGLGLAIVKAIVEAHGGQVAAFSAGKGQGSLFTVCLPAT